MLSCGHTFDSEFEIWILSFNFQIARRETARRQARNYPANLDSVDPFWILTYHRTTVHALPGYPPPPSPRVRCHLACACVYFLLTLLDFDDTNESGPNKNYPDILRTI